MRSTFGVLLALVCSGCTSFGLERNPLNATQAALDRDGGFYVALAANGEYGGKPYPDSGRAVTSAVTAALQKRALRVEAATTAEPFEASLEAARVRNLKYLALPTILQWEDRATEWSGLPDRISIRLGFIDSASGQAVDTGIVTGRSKWATFGGDHPQDLLGGALTPYVDQALGIVDSGPRKATAAR